MASKDFHLRGANADAFICEDPRVLLAGPSGTGKTITWLTKLYQFGMDFPGTRILLVRKERSTLTETGLVTWERDILGPNHVMLTRNPILRRVRQNYDFWTEDCKRKNGTTLVVGGLDNPEKILSGDYDLIYMLEATDFTLDDYETLATRLRTGVSRYRQIIADCNPTTPTHWLFQQINNVGADGKPKMRGFKSSHKDNPAYWDQERRCWTPLGREYVMTTLRNMTGARRKRFYRGIWAAAEGLVYDGFDEAIHLMPPGWRPPDHWPRAWSIDWGYTAPMSLVMAAIDPNGRMYVYREFYATNTRVEILAKRMGKLVSEQEEPRPIAILGDHDPECIATWRAHSGLPCSLAYKEDKYHGIEVTQARFDKAKDGKPRVFFVPGSRINPRDETLAAAGRPTCLLEEIPGYIWNTENPDKLKEEPVKVNDHGCDNLRYLAVFFERYRGGALKAATGKPTDRVIGDIQNQQF